MFKLIGHSYIFLKPILSDEFHHGVILKGEPIDVMHKFFMLDWDITPTNREEFLLINRTYRRQISLAKQYQRWKSGQVKHKLFQCYPSYVNYKNVGEEFYVRHYPTWCKDTNCCNPPVDTGMNGYPSCKIGDLV